MGTLITLVLRVIDLVALQGRAAKRTLSEFAVALALLATAAALAAMTCAAAAGALLAALWTVMPPAAALAIVAAILGLLTWIAAMIAIRYATPRELRQRR